MQRSNFKVLVLNSGFLSPSTSNCNAPGVLNRFIIFLSILDNASCIDSLRYLPRFYLLAERMMCPWPISNFWSLSVHILYVFRIVALTSGLTRTNFLRLNTALPLVTSIYNTRCMVYVTGRSNQCCHSALASNRGFSPYSSTRETGLVQPPRRCLDQDAKIGDVHEEPWVAN